MVCLYRYLHGSTLQWESDGAHLWVEAYRRRKKLWHIYPVGSFPKSLFHPSSGRIDIMVHIPKPCLHLNRRKTQLVHQMP
jgi:hypothetical protein